MKGDIIDVLKSSIRKSGKTHYRLAKESGVSAAIIDRFMSGKRDINVATASKLTAVLDLRLHKK